MASSADQMAASLSLNNFAKATDLKKRLWFTLGALIVFRFLSFVPLPGIDPVILKAQFDTTKGGVLDFINMFSGGALQRMSIVALGVMPYITASIVVQLGTSLSPALANLKKEGESGRKKINQYTRYGTVLLAAVQGYFISVGLEAWSTSGQSAVVEPGLLFRMACVISLVGGTLFLMWLGEQITSRGIGNGISLIVMAGIVANLPTALSNLFEGGRTNTMSPLLIIAIMAGVIGLIAGICFMERAQRRVLIQYPKRASARGGMQQDKSFLPLKINTANVIPPIFASSLLLMPLTIAQFAGKSAVAGESMWSDIVLAITTSLQHGSPLYMTLYGAGIIFFCFFYTAVVFNPEETAENLKKNGGFVPGIRPGKSTEDYLDYVLTRITVLGAGYLTFICLVPEFAVAQAGIPFYLGGTSLLIVVNVTIDTVSQIQSHLLAHQYGDLIKKAKLKGGKRR
jgi:preprotein translocase subunit SecY